MSPARDAAAGPARARTRNVARREVDPVRQLAWQTLRAVSDQDAYANLELPRRLRAARLSGRDAGFATELTYGALRGQGTYDLVLAACVDRPLAEIDPPLLDALRLGAHQLLAMRVPPHAAVAATVDLVRADVGQGAAGFANAVLRRLSEHDLEGWLGQVAPSAADDPDGHLAATTSHPVWIVRALRDALAFSGRDVAELPRLLAADNDRPEVTLAALPGLSTPQEVGEPWGPSPLSARVSGAVHDVRAVRQGRARVQDAGSQLVALALATAALDGPDGGRWLDLCAGPGGKSAVLGAVLAGRMAADGPPAGSVLVANDLTAHRVDLVRQSVAAVVERSPGLVEPRQGDGRRLGEDEPGRYDRVLVDAPCTGLGALRRRPEARWRRRPSDLSELGPLQRDLLRSALAAVRPGGVVAYATCSPHPAETRLVVDDVLREHPDVQLVDAPTVVDAVSSGAARDLGAGPDVQMWPHVHGTDAMYLALLRRG